ncbi:MAG: hypothetical protein ABIS50_01730 [Luteolibacter sp.]
MTFYQTLYHATWLGQVAANVAVMICAYPAFKSTGHRAFFFILFGYLIGTFDTIFDHTTLPLHKGHPSFIAYLIARKLSYIVCITSTTTGLVLLIRSYMRLAKANAPQAGEPVAIASVTGDESQ